MIDVLVPTFARPAALAVTLTSLAAQTYRNFRVVISDQTEGADVSDSGEVQAVCRLLRLHGHEVLLRKHLPRRGMAEHRQSLLEQAVRPYALFMDDDLILEPYVLQVMLQTMRREGCGFVGCAPIGLSFLEDTRPHEETVEFWEGPVGPEQVEPSSPAWQRHRLHNAANVLHLQHRLGITPDRPRTYRVAWVGACVLFDVAALKAAGGFAFWQELPAQHAGEDALAQLRVMSQRGGCGLLPSGVYHQELPTTISDRTSNAPHILKRLLE